MVALERPGASGDQGVYADRIELQNIKPRFPLPDFSAPTSTRQKWGYVRAAGMLREIKWDDMLDDQFDLSGDATGWGFNLSSNLKAGKNDVAPAAVRVRRRHRELHERLAGRHRHREQPSEPASRRSSASRCRSSASSSSSITPGTTKFTSAVGYSSQDIDNTDGQAPDAFKTGQYALGNLLYTPVPNVMVGGELSGAGARTSPTASTATGSRSSSRSSTTSRGSLEASHDDDGYRATRRCCRRCRARWR